MSRTLFRSRSTLDLAVSSTLAVAVSLAVGHPAAKAANGPSGSFQGSSTVVVPGSATVSTGINTTTITVNSQRAVINWAPNDTAVGGGPINFQPSGTTATFVNNPSSTADFAVLNNILPTDPSRMVQFNGTVISQLQTLAGASSTGGTVYFYAPGGILVGPSAVINVGNLGLTANPITYDASGNFGATGSVINNGTQTVTFGQANAGSSVQISTGAKINANTTDGSYVAVVAPLINNRGTINVNGNAALVAADAATITFNPNGLYSISLDVGTSATGTTLFNGGTITGAAANTAQGGPVHQIYLMTAPKNTLIGMLIGQGSNIGFDVAGAANTVGNSIILTGGYDVANGSLNTAGAPKGLAGANINVTGSNVTSKLTLLASNNAQVDGFNGSTTTLASDVSVLGYNTAFLGAFANSSLTANGTVQVQALDHGSSAAPGTSVSGGTAAIFATGGTVALRGTFNTIDASAGGATSTTSGVKAGSSTGGSAQIYANTGGSITVDGSLYVSAEGRGGYSRTDGVVGGDGRGGFVQASVSDTNASLTFKSNVFLRADGYGGTGTCLTLCTAEAGMGFGGNAQVIAQQGSTTPGSGSSITSLDTNGSNTFYVSATGIGGQASNTNAGNGSGGSVLVSADNGNALNLGSQFSASADGNGGGQNGTRLIGGNGTGGSVNVLLHPGANFTADKQFSIDANALGGAGDPDSAGTGSSGGAATGGTARIFSDGGNGAFNGAVNVSADGFGGYSGAAGTTGAGGAGTGGSAIINIGNATTNTNNATLTFSGSSNIVSAAGSGGRGYPGGMGTGGLALTRTFYGTIKGTSFTFDSSGVGGDGTSNGAGGAGIGGQSSLLARNNPFGTATITLDAATINSVGNGGAGGASFSPTLGGGAGGSGTGGNAFATADAGDGKLTVNNQISGYSGAIGGNGGRGADNPSGPGSNGGAGGAAFGAAAASGGTQIGSQSGVAGTTAAGVTSFGSLIVSGVAQGGTGGDGGNFGVASAAQGNGGAGGSAEGGGATLLVRGTPVTVTGQTILSADAIGGNGGLGAVQGNGGNARVGSDSVGNGGQAGVLVTNRFQVPTQRGTLTAGAIAGSAAAVGGSGAVAGISAIGDQPINFTITNSDVTAASVNLLASAGTVALNAVPSVTMLSGGTVNIGSSFQFGSSGPITIALDTATLNAGFVGLSGSDWILPTTPPVLAGTINAGTGASFRSGNNIVTYANVNFNYPVGFNVIGNFQLGNITTPGDFASFSGGTTTFGSLSATNVDIQAANAISVGPVTSQGFVSLDNSGSGSQGLNIGSITVGPIYAGRDVGLFSNQSIFAQGLIQAGANVDIEARGSATVGNISAGLVSPSTKPGDTFEILVKSGGPLIVGNLASQTDIGLLSNATIAVGNLSGRDMQLLGAGAISTGAITASSRVLLADASMAALGTTATGYDPNPAFAATAVRTSGAISVAGPVNAASFSAASNQGFTATGAITTSLGNTGPSGVTLDAGGPIQTAALTGFQVKVKGDSDITTGNIQAGVNANLKAGGALAVGNVITNGAIVLDAGATLNAGTLNGNFGVFATAIGNITVGNVTTTATSTTPGSAAGQIIIGSRGAVTAGVLRASTDLAVIANGALTVSTANGRDVLLLAGNSTRSGAITTSGDLLIANASLGPLGNTGPTTPYNFRAVFNAQPANTGGAVTITGPVTTALSSRIFAGGPIVVPNMIQAGRQVQLSSIGSIATGNITAGFAPTTSSFVDINIDAGGALATGNLQTTASAVLHSLSTIQTGTINANFLGVLGGSTVSTGSINANSALFANQSFYTGQTTAPFDGTALLSAVDAQQPINPASVGTVGSILINGSVTGNLLKAYSAQDITVGGSVQESNIAILRAFGNIAAGNLQGGQSAQAIAGGNLVVGDVTGGSITATPVSGSTTTRVVVSSGGSVTAGNLRSSTNVLLTAQQTAQTGSISTGDLLALVHGASNTGPISATGRVLMADSTMTALGNTTQVVNGVTRPLFDPNLVFNAATVSSAGPITINGAVSAASLTTDSLGAFTSGAITTANFVDVTTGGNALVNGAVQSGEETSINAQGGITVGNIKAGAPMGTREPIPFSIGLLANGGPVVAGNLSGSQAIGIGSSGSITTGTLSGANLLVGGGSTINTGAISVSGKALLASYAMIPLGGMPGSNTPYDATLVFAATPIAAPGAITINGNVNTGEFLHAATLQGFTSGAITTGTDLSLAVGGAAQVGSLGAGGPITINTDSLVLGGGVSTPGSLSIATVQALTTQNLTIGGNIAVTSQNALTTGNVTSSNGSVKLTAGSTLAAGAISAATTATLSSVGTMQTGAISAGNQVTISADSFVLGSPTTPGTIVTTGGGLSITTTKALVLPTLSIFGNVALDSRTALTTGDVTSTAGSIALSSAGSLTAGALKANTTLSLTTPGAITAGNTTNFAGLAANGNITISGGDVTVLAGNSTSSKAVLTILGTGALNLDTAFGTTSVSLTAGTNLRTTGASVTGAVTETAGGSIDTGQINAGGISISAGTTFQSGNLSSSKDLAVTTGGNLSTANLAANGGSAMIRSGGTLNVGVINTTNGILVNSTGAATVQGLTSSGAITFNSNSTFASTGQIVSANQIIGGANGNMALTNVTSSGGAGTIELSSTQGSITAGRISAATDVATIAGGSLSLGQVSGRDLVLLAGTNVQSGAISAGAVLTQGAITGATGRVLIANATAGTAGGKFGTYDFNAVFNQVNTTGNDNALRVGGTVNLTGTVNAGQLRALAQGALTGQVINAYSKLEAESGDLLTVGQQWFSPDITLRSNDIAILPSLTSGTFVTKAGITSGASGVVALISLNANGAFIGDGLTTGQGYALSNAEWGLVQSGSLTIGAVDNPNLATDMTIGALAVTGPNAGSTIDNKQDGAVLFITGNRQSEVVSGTIRVTGAITAKGFLAANQLQFKTGTFELDNTVGSLTVTDSSNALAGGIAISADHIHIAAASILDKLRVDPLYATRIADLNTPPTQPLANPVLSAAQLIFAPTQTLYIQNTGTAAVPAGFFVPLAGLTIKLPSSRDTQPGQIAAAVSLVMNGQFVGTSSTTGTGQSTGAPAPITGATAFQQFVQTKPTGLTADSQFNGCVIAAGSCSMMSTPTPDLSTQIQVLQTPTLPSSPAIVEAVQLTSADLTADPQEQEQTADKPTEAEQKEEEKAQASAKSPIAPPAPMIDTRPLSPPVSVDEPVAGGGNPALFGIGSAPNQTDGGDK